MQDGGKNTDYEASYSKDVLGLAAGESEEQIDVRLIAEAKQLGLDVKEQRPSKPSSTQQSRRPLSMPVLSTDALPRRSSVDSRASGAASMVSTSSSVPRQSNGVATSRASLSFRDYDNFLARGRPEGRASMSFSPPPTRSGSASAFSLPLSSPESSPKKHYRLMRGLSMLKLNRADAATSAKGCPHCPRDPFSQRRAVHKLPCGHRLCTKALRDTIMGATTSGTGAIPSCCGIPVPGYLVEHVMTQQEQSVVLDRLEQWSRADSATPSVKSEAPASETMRRPGTSRTASDESKVDSVRPDIKPQTSTDGPQDAEEDARPEIARLRREQSATRDRFLAWIESRRSHLAADRERWHHELKARHEAVAEALEETHAQAMAEAEDKQVKAEADLRAAHAQEERDAATALRHMEAYCAGTYVSTGQAHGRAVAPRDLAELAHARGVREGMRGRQDSAINVLRGEQARRLRLRAQRQEREVGELRRAQRREEMEGEREWGERERVLEEFGAGRWAVLAERWEVEGRVLGRRLGREGDGREVDWREEGEDGCLGGGHTGQAVNGAAAAASRDAPP